MQKVLAILGCLAGIGFSVLSDAQGAPLHYRVIHEFHLDGDDRWDCLTSDDATGRLFVSHGTQVQVVDEGTGKLIGAIPDTQGVHAIALAPDLNKGFVSNGKEASVTVFDLKTLQTQTKVAVTGQNPDIILYDDFSHQLFVFNGKSANVTVMDAKTNNIVTTVSLDGKPEFSVSDGKGNVYVNLEDKSSVAVINAKTLKVVNKWSIAPGQSPSGMAIDRKRNRLFIVCENKLMVIADPKTQKIIGSLPIGEHADGAAFDPASNRAYSSNGDGTLTVVQESDNDNFKVLETVLTHKGARTLALDLSTHHIFLPTAEFGPAPTPTVENPKPRPAIIPGTFTILDVAALK